MSHTISSPAGNLEYISIIILVPTCLCTKVNHQFDCIKLTKEPAILCCIVSSIYLECVQLAQLQQTEWWMRERCRCSITPSLVTLHLFCYSIGQKCLQVQWQQLWAWADDIIMMHGCDTQPLAKRRGWLLHLNEMMQWIVRGKKGWTWWIWNSYYNHNDAADNNWSFRCFYKNI